ncbi:MAG TPA: ATP-binding protein [Myxococcota bacterium]|nr:ATP-binding protein [Myxococcota bacterium]
MPSTRSRPALVVLVSLASLVAVMAATFAAVTATASAPDAGPGVPWRAIFLASVAGLVAAALIDRVLTGRLIHPLRRIERFASDVAAGDLDRRLRWRAGGELGRIADSLDRMADELQRRIDEATSEKEQLQAVLAGMVEGVLVVNAQGRLVLANPRLREMFAVWGEVSGRAPLEVIRHAGVDDALRVAAATTELVAREIQVGSGDGARSILVHAAAYPPGGPRLGTVAVFHDVTELRRLESLRRDFVANVSHELKTPLTAIRGFAETLVSADVPAEDLEKYLSVILRHAERLSNLIEDLLELSRIESRKVPLRVGPVDVARVAASIMTGMEPQLRARRLEVKLVPSDAPPALADRGALEQILTNLLDNAAKYTNPGGHVEVRIAGDGDEVRVEVRDDGMGIPKEDQPRIFERFYRVDKARSRDLGGTGLGLAIVKHLVQAMDGDIYVSSEPGRGSTFTFLLPKAAATEVPSTRA